MNWLVLGGTGLVGRRLVEMLISRGNPVDVVTRGHRSIATGTGVIVADISRPGWEESLQSRRYDIICHLAYADTNDAAYNKAILVDSVITMMAMAPRLSAKHFIYLGSMAVFGENTPDGTVDETLPKLGETDYARNKIAATMAVTGASENIMVTVLHPTGIYDRESKRISFYRDMLRLGYIDVPLTGLNNIVHAQDVVQAIVSCANGREGRMHEEYILNGESITYAEWIAILERRFSLSGRLRLPRYISAFIRGPFGRLARRLGLRRALCIPAYKAALYRLQTRFSSEKARRDFGYLPAKSFAEEMGR